MALGSLIHGRGGVEFLKFSMMWHIPPPSIWSQNARRESGHRAFMRAFLSSARLKPILTLVCLFVVIVTIFSGSPFWSRTAQFRRASLESPEGECLVQTIEKISDYLIDYPLVEGQVGEMGRRVELLHGWLKFLAASILTSEQSRRLATRIEELASSLFPFLPRNRSLLSWESDSFVPDSRGIVITTGVGTFRFACHLISCIRDVLESNLPIQIVYAGDDDLPSSYRQTLMSLGHHIETLDILTVFDDSTLELSKGGWAIKPFAILATRFQHVLLLDADAVFLQPPESIFDSHSGYHKTGTLLFR